MEEIELIHKRGRREKHFLQKDGTILAKVYDEDIHYLKDGVYQEIDNTLIEENGYYKNKSNDYQVQFKKDLEDPCVKMEKDGYYLDISFVNNAEKRKRKKASVIKDEVSYDEVYENVRFSYQALSTKLKETITLQNGKQREFTFLVSTNLVLEKSGSMIFAKDKDAIIFTIDPPFMEDALGVRNYDIEYQLIDVFEGYELHLVLDKKWLDDPERKYPVNVDPTITNQNQMGGMQDTYIYSGDTNVDRNSHPYLIAGVDTINGAVCRSLVHFELPKIGTGSEIVHAEIVFIGYLGDQDVSKYPIASIHRITSPWTEYLANWNNMHNNYDSKVEALMECRRSSVLGNTLKPIYCGADITHLVKKWYKDTPNYGVLIKSLEEVYKGEDLCPKFFSKNNQVQGDNPKPILEISYRNQNGLESYFHYKEQNFTNGNVYINTFNGNLVSTFDIGRTIGGVMPARLQLVYNTNDVVLEEDRSCGLGYRFNFDQTIKPVTISNHDYLEYVDEDGTIHYFSKDNFKQDDLYYDEDGMHLVIEKTDTSCIMKDKNDNKMSFVKIGDSYHLSKIEDIDLNTIDILFDTSNRISKIVDKNHAEILIEYGEDIITITSPDDIVLLNYTGNSLTSITSKEGVISLTYHDEHIISRITDVTGLAYSYEYYEKSPYKVKRVVQYGLNNTEGGSYTLDYGFHSTVVVDDKERCETLIFNDRGNLISSNNMSNNEDIKGAYSFTQEYGDDDFNPNKVLSSNALVGYIKNYLKNTSFEDDRDFFIIDEEEEWIEKSFSTEYAYSGNRSLKIVTKRAERVADIRVKVPKGKNYTFSGYFKNHCSFEVSLCYFGPDGWVKSTEIVDRSLEFERSDVTIYYDENASSDLIIRFSFADANIVYIDDIQLEEGEVANSYNFIENSDFSEGITDWELSASKIDNEEAVSTASFFECVKFNNNQNTALKVKMNPLYNLSFHKEYPICGKVGELYTVSFWYKNEGIEGILPYAGNYVSINFHPIDDNQPGHCVITSPTFNRNDDRWQYYSYRVRSLEDFDKITVTFYQNMEANDFYITNLSFYKNVTSGDYKYDLEGNLISYENQSKEENIFKYDRKNQLINATTPMGQDFKYEYDNQKTDRVLSAIASNGLANEIEYDLNGNPIRTRISKKYSKQIENAEYRIRSKGTDQYLKAELYSVLLESNPCSNTIWKIEKQEDKYKILYAVLPENSIYWKNDTLMLTKLDQDNLFSLEKQENGSYYIKFISSEKEKYLKAEGHLLKFTEFDVDNPSFYEFYFELVDEMFMENSATYSEDGRFIESVTTTNLNTISYEVNPDTGLILSMTNPLGQKSYYTYNDKKQITSVKLAEKEVFYHYDNNLLSKIQFGNKEYKFIYDDFLNVKKLMLGDLKTFITNNYDLADQLLLSQTYGNSQEITYDYDKFNRLSLVHTMNDDYHYKYDNHGNIAKIKSRNHKERYDYDISGRLYKYRYDDFKIYYKYNLHNAIIEKKYKIDDSINQDSFKHEITYTFDENDFLKQVMLDNISMNYSYDDLGRIIGTNLNNQYDTFYEYFSNGNRATEMIKNIEYGNNRYSYTYDGLNNITDIYYNNVKIKHYEYGLYNELVVEQDYVFAQKIEYSYDYSGNLLSKKYFDLNNNTLIKTDIYQYNDDCWEDLLTNYNGVDITYDSIGNPLTIGDDIVLNWINGRQLDYYKDFSKGFDIQYSYNREGIRTSKIVNGVLTKYYLEDTHILYERCGNDCIYYLYDLTGLIGLEYNGCIYYYVKNLQDDIIAILDSSYNQVVSYEYDSWGKVLNIKDALGNEITDPTHIGFINPFRYRSYYYDRETELYYLNSRYYNPEWGRFINADAVIGANKDLISYNLFAYVSNNPIMYSDETGTSFFSAISKSMNKIAKTVKKAANVVLSKNNTLPNYSTQLNKVLHNNATIASYHKQVLSSSVNQLEYFYQQENHGKPWDYKVEENWKRDIDLPYLGITGPFIYNGKITTAEDFGNIHYGYVGKIMGFSDTLLYMAGGYAHCGANILVFIGPCYCDDPNDHSAIKRGIDMYSNGQ